MPVFHRSLALLAALALTFAAAAPALAHCDTADGPVAQDVNRAVASGDVTPVLKWVTAADEAEVRRVFAQAQEVRAAGGVAAELADRYFLETAVRLHRQSESAPYTGVKPAGTPVSPMVAAVDGALHHGSVAELVRDLQQRVADAVATRFETAHHAASHAEHSLEAGRAAVHAYVELTHFAEHLDALLSTEAAGHEHGSASTHQ